MPTDLENNVPSKQCPQHITPHCSRLLTCLYPLLDRAKASGGQDDAYLFYQVFSVLTIELHQYRPSVNIY